MAPLDRGIGESLFIACLNHAFLLKFKFKFNKKTQRLEHQKII